MIRYKEGMGETTEQQRIVANMMAGMCGMEKELLNHMGNEATLGKFMIKCLEKWTQRSFS